jgi:hypothetical protein
MNRLPFRAELSEVEEWSELGSRDMDGKAGGRVSWERASQSLAVNRGMSRLRST